MDRLRNLWREEDIGCHYQVSKHFAFFHLAILLIMWCLNSIFETKNSLLTFYCLPVITFQGLLSLLFRFAESKSMSTKCLVSIFTSECNFTVWYLMSFYEENQNKILFAIASFAGLNVIEMPFIKSFWIRVLLIFKHHFLWHFIPKFTGNNGSDIYSESNFMPIIAIFLCEWRVYMMREKSYERFVSRVNLEKAEKRLKLIFNLFSDGILIISEQKEVLFSNLNLTKLLNCSIEEVISFLTNTEYCQGRKQSNLSNTNKLIDDINLIRTLDMNQEINLGLSQHGDLYIGWRGQRILWEEQDAVLLTVSNANHIIEYEKTVSDSKLKNVLLRSISHELRTPINSIIFLVESIKEEYSASGNEKLQSKLNIISVSSKILLSLVNDLLDYSKILAGIFSAQKTDVSLWNFIHETVQLIQIQAEKKGLNVFIRIDPNLPSHVFTDPLRLSQILLNLLSNALKFTLKGCIEICCILDKNQQLKITVKDTGIGITKDKLRDLFKEFATHFDSALNPTGCGLGLFISNIIAKEIGSKTIDVKSVPNEGSIFSFSIDIFRNFPPAQTFIDDDSTSDNIFEEKALIMTKDFNKVIKNQFTQVLIADDNDFNRIVLGTLLSNYNILYHEACSGKQAVKYVQDMDEKKKPYKLIIMDGSMPELNGWEASRAILDLYAEGKISSLPIIIGYTAFTSDIELSLCIRSGMKECIIKPCNSELLISKIKHYLPR
ncbi:unnamed protein product [Blepharisma stoltei]|uniref:Histidine kinase n=1 Tax=Blepharisma stoltei TaxID=1481888 RepID=A0AAU9K222_9CILI|nr:unnamed protein product [Blepharisma stoltei]